MTETPTHDRARPRRRPARRYGPLHHAAQLCLGCVIAGLAIMLLVAAVLGAGVTAPGWVSERVGARISDRLAALAGFRHDGAVARCRHGPAGRAARGHAARCRRHGARRSGAAGYHALARRVAARGSRARPCGWRGRLILRRAADGTLSVSLRETGEAGGRHPPRDRPFPEQIGAMLSRPMLAELRRSGSGRC